MSYFAHPRSRAALHGIEEPLDDREVWPLSISLCDGKLLMMTALHGHRDGAFISVCS